jgi:hypothetical protein
MNAWALNVDAGDVAFDSTRPHPDLGAFAGTIEQDTRARVSTTITLTIPADEDGIIEYNAITGRRTVSRRPSR